MEEMRATAGGREVTVHVLRVDGKKMTLQFFKQLPKRDFFVEDATPDPALNYWGRVTYLLQDGGEAWLLAEVDGQLYRCAIYKSEIAIKSLERTRELLAKHRADGMATLVSIYEKQVAETQPRAELEQRRRPQLDKLDALPQLFIAA